MLEERPACKPIDVIFGARRKTSRPVSGMNRERRETGVGKKGRKKKEGKETVYGWNIKAGVRCSIERGCFHDLINLLYRDKWKIRWYLNRPLADLFAGSLLPYHRARFSLPLLVY